MCCNELILDMCLCESYMHEEYIVIYLRIMHIEILSYGFGLTMIFKWVMLCRIVQVSRVSIGIRKWKILFMLNSRRRRMKRWTKHLEDLKRRNLRSLKCIKKLIDSKGYTFSYRLFSFVRIEVLHEESSNILIKSWQMFLTW